MFAVKKKGGIFIKKLNIFLILFLSLFISTIKVNATSFYEADYISNIYLKRYSQSLNYTYYQQARFIRKMGTNDIIYCIEPFMLIDSNTNYQATTTPENLTNKQKEDIERIAFFGYGYGNHTDPKWYAITQIMIWKVANPEGDFYFTDTLNGNRINSYQEEINEINNLIKNYTILPSFANQSFDIVENQVFTLEDTTNTISNYSTTNKNITIEGNKLIINNLKAANHTILLTEKKYVNPIQYFFATSSQNLVQRGELSKRQFSLNLNVQKTTLKILKVDKDTQSVIPSGEASLEGTIFTLLDKNKEKIKDLVVENGQILLSNLPYDTYYIQETQAGEGYQINNTLLEVILTKDNANQTIQVENESIKKRIQIEKKYGTENNLKQEENISFSIINNKEEVIEIITTNEHGIAEATLPYGTYTIKQMNTTEGYEIIDPFQIKVDNSKEEIIELKDIEIPVPDTYLEKKDNLPFLIFILLKVFLW